MGLISEEIILNPGLQKASHLYNRLPTDPSQHFVILSLKENSSNRKLCNAQWLLHITHLCLKSSLLVGLVVKLILIKELQEILAFITFFDNISQ